MGGILSNLPDAWREFVVCIYVYLLAALYCVKEVIFEASNQGIRKKLEKEIEENPLFEHDGRVAVVTGADGVIGREIVRHLLKYDFTVHALVGDRERAKFYYNAVVGTDNRLKIYDVNLEQPDAVCDFARDFSSRSGSINLMVICAGTMLAPEKHIDGVEIHQCVNVVSQCLLLDMLSARLNSSSSVVFLSSVTARAAVYNKEHFLHGSALSTYTGPYQNYALSKFVMALYVKELAKESEYNVVCLHPGIVPGTLYRHTNLFIRSITYIVLPYLLRKPTFAALLVLHTALRTDVQKGAYYEDCEENDILSQLNENDRSLIYTTIRKKVEAWKNM